MAKKCERPKWNPTEVKSLGKAEIPSTLGWDRETYIHDEAQILQGVDWQDVRRWIEQEMEPPRFELAGPRSKVFFQPSELTAGIVTCGGLCPGLNDVIRTITLTLLWQYKVKRVLGFCFGYEGISSNARKEPIELSASAVDSIQHLGGTILGASGGYDFGHLTRPPKNGGYGRNIAEIRGEPAVCDRGRWDI
ncbi:MAG: 6-phosphofructokinase [Planctomycetota bacterium]|jgi:6-phosphofructokinase 1